MVINFDPQHSRVQKARLKRRWSSQNRTILLWTIIVFGVFVGVAATIAFGRRGLPAFIPTIWASMFVCWLRSQDLSNKPGVIDADPEQLSLHTAVEQVVVAKLHNHQSPQAIWRAVRGTWREQFFSLRYGFGRRLLDEHLSIDAHDADYVWRLARQLAEYEGKTEITAGNITVALITTLPHYESILAELHISFDDLCKGLLWQNHIQLVIERIKAKRSFGGIGRDWAAGYTPILNQLGRNLSSEVEYGNGMLLRDVGSHRAIIDQMVRYLSGGGRPNIALVGEVGTGKTTLAYAFAQRLLLGPQAPSNLQYHQVFAIDAPTFIARAKNTGNVEQLLIRLLNEAYAAKNIILFFDDAQLFFSDGPGAVDLRNALTPVIENAAIRMVFAFTPRDWQNLSAQNPALAGLLNYQVVAEPDEENTVRIMEDQVLLTEGQHHVTFTYQAIHEAYRLAGRYIHDLSYPARGIRIMEAAVNQADRGLVTEASVQRSIETMLGVKVQTAGQDEKRKLLNLEDEIHKRMINQKRAVAVVSDALRRARSGVTNPQRPIGTFLFLGPTGVGKTELAKAVAEVYFNGDEHIIRLDMNEYVRSEDVSRLLAPIEQNGTGLIAQIRRQPFSVVLFDEIEKAHPDVINVFLQVLDEGILRDTHNKETSFRDAIMIATSNAGADRIRAEISAGRNVEEFEEDFTNQLIDSGQFKPEFLNRFDEIVIFRPLTPDELLQVVDLMVFSLNKTLARQKVQVQLTLEAKRWLVDHGYDARLGARPLRRMVQRSVENIIARRLLDESFLPGSLLTLDASDLERFAQDTAY